MRCRIPPPLLLIAPELDDTTAPDRARLSDGVHECPYTYHHRRTFVFILDGNCFHFETMPLGAGQAWIDGLEEQYRRLTADLRFG